MGIAIARYYLLKDSKYLTETENILDILFKLGMSDSYKLYRSWTNQYKKMIGK